MASAITAGSVAGAVAAPGAAFADVTKAWATTGVSYVSASGSATLRGEGEVKQYEECYFEGNIYDTLADGRSVGIQIRRFSASGTSYWTVAHTGGGGTSRSFSLTVNVDMQVNPYTQVREYRNTGSGPVYGDWKDACTGNYRDA